MADEKHPICLEWEEYYQTLEKIRDLGITNMWGAAPYLKAEHPELSHEKATQVLLSWISNYSELADKYSWRR